MGPNGDPMANEMSEIMKDMIDQKNCGLLKGIFVYKDCVSREHIKTYEEKQIAIEFRTV